MPGWQLPHSRDHRAWAGHVREHEERIDRVRVELTQLRLDLEQRGQFRGEQQLAVVLVQEQRLLAEAVAREQQAPAALIPDGKGEHALQGVHHRLAVFLIQVNQHLGIGVRCELVPPPPEVLAQLRVVVDLAVERRPHRSVLVAQRLMAPGYVHDRQTAGADRHPAGRIAVHPLVVGSTVAQGRAHRPHRAAVGVLRTPCNTAHSGKHR